MIRKRISKMDERSCGWMLFFNTANESRASVPRTCLQDDVLHGIRNDIARTDGQLAGAIVLSSALVPEGLPITLGTKNPLSP